MGIVCWTGSPQTGEIGEGLFEGVVSRVLDAGIVATPWKLTLVELGEALRASHFLRFEM